MLKAALISTIVIISLLPCSLSAKFPQRVDDEWYCGSDGISQFLLESQFELDCPRWKRQINKCCKQHDDCYGDQSGRKYCDDKLCGCLTVATRGSGVCAREDGPLLCLLVRELGEEAYKRSKPVTTMPEP
ncbi:hypothetical protein KIN20_035942 [Parelaphostrongylus tenuis]|uniref:Uncharacterized protein n=1 Tax=Parelaphostrongylus tenuis TaxID=148309 RepID=A0AAD5RCB3_PARTN|nr:hypothetical protein KIN20_035942 [Parelaphostrongylus tenuis]